MVYLLYCPDSLRQHKCLTKIGFTQNEKSLSGRINNLTTACPYVAEILFLSKSTAATKNLEGHLHTVFGQYRVKGEWFNLPEEICEGFRDLATCLEELPCLTLEDDIAYALLNLQNAKDFLDVVEYNWSNSGVEEFYNGDMSKRL